MAVAVVAVVAGLLYVRAVRRHPRRWPLERSAAFAGAVAAALATPAVGDATLTRHMVEHLLVGMAVPFLVALAAPVTLALQTGAPATRRVLRAALHSPAARALVHPVVGLCLFGAGLVAVYLSPLLELAAEHEAVHVAVHAHLLTSGLLFVVPLVGADVLPRPVPHAARFLAVLVAVPFHAFLGVAMLSADEPLAPDAYPNLDDQRRAAGVLWAGGEALSLAAAGVAFARWWAAEQRAGAIRARSGHAGGGQDGRVRMLAIVDIDGVVADVRHRLHHLERRPKDWDAFFAAAVDDPPHDEGVAVVAELAAEHEVVFLSGRPRRLERDTQRWLDTHGLGGHRLVLRPDGDRRPAAQLKVRLLRELAGGREVAVVVDDDALVIEAMEAAGYPTFHATWERLAAEDEAALRTAQEVEGRT